MKDRELADYICPPAGAFDRSKAFCKEVVSATIVSLARGQWPSSQPKLIAHILRIVAAIFQALFDAGSILHWEEPAAFCAQVSGKDGASSDGSDRSRNADKTWPCLALSGPI